MTLPNTIRQWARKVVDAAWQEATESSQVPSTKWADRIIDGIGTEPFELLVKMAAESCSRASSLMGRECHQAIPNEPRRWCAPCLCTRIVADRHPSDTKYWAPMPSHGCYCGDVAGEDPNCPMHGRGV